MTNFGWNKNCELWQENRKWVLAEELEKAISRLGINIEIATGNKSYKNDGQSPYIEVDMPREETAYGGVRIRRITHLSEEQQEKLVEEAERIYSLVMNNLIRE
jgi:hypothetical protein